MKVTLYIRQGGTRKYIKATKKFYEPGTVFVLRYGSTWETVGEVKLVEAERARLNRSVQLLGGWQPAVKPKPKPASLMLDAAMDAYLSEICSSRKKKRTKLTLSRCATSTSALAINQSKTSIAATS